MISNHYLPSRYYSEAWDRATRPAVKQQIEEHYQAAVVGDRKWNEQRLVDQALLDVRLKAVIKQAISWESNLHSNLVQMWAKRIVRVLYWLGYYR